MPPPVDGGQHTFGSRRMAVTGRYRAGRARPGCAAPQPGAGRQLVADPAAFRGRVDRSAHLDSVEPPSATTGRTVTGKPAGQDSPARVSAPSGRSPIAGLCGHLREVLP